MSHVLADLDAFPRVNSGLVLIAWGLPVSSDPGQALQQQALTADDASSLGPGSNAVRAL